MINYFQKTIFLLLLLTMVPSVSFAAQPFEQWLAEFKQEALSKNISQNTLDQAFASVTPIERIIELDRKQPEGTLTFAQYKDRVISQDRISQGRRLYWQHKHTLDEIAQKYGVPGNFVVALWGIETSYGNNTGGFGVVPALATLAHDGRRSEFFRGELLKALQILDAGHITPAAMKGSWAGAMGQNQFMPSSFFAYAVDEDGDGKRDIWGTLADVFASTANYLHKNGWNHDQRWGREVKLPQGFSQSLTGREVKKSLQEWSNMGITLPNGSKIPVVQGMQASVIVPDGIGGPAFLVYNNYNVIMKWNRSVYFATSVGLLADKIIQ